jgi:hypothetical protein
MNKTLIVLGSLFGAIFLIGATLAFNYIGFSNTEIDLKNRFTQKMDERTAFYDKMWKTLSQKSEIALKNDSSFARNVDAIMAGRKDAGDVFMKWVQETNPNANFEAVSSLYADLSRAVEGQRDGFFMQEKMLQSIVLEHSNHLQKFPGSFWNMIANRQPIEYKPITSTRTDDVMKSGKDDNVKLF